MARLKIGIMWRRRRRHRGRDRVAQAGHNAEIYEQESSLPAGRRGYQFDTECGARARQPGRVPALKETAARPTHRISRMWDTGEDTSHSGNGRCRRGEVWRAAADGSPRRSAQRAARPIPQETSGSVTGQAIEITDDSTAISFDIMAANVSSRFWSARTASIRTRTTLFWTGAVRLFTGLVSYRSLWTARASRSETRLSPNGGGRLHCRLSHSRSIAAAKTSVGSATPQPDGCHEFVDDVQVMFGERRADHVGISS